MKPGKDFCIYCGSKDLGVKWATGNSTVVQLITAEIICNDCKRRQIDIKPCPSCRSYDLVFFSNIAYGHGDSTYEGGIKCLSCGMKHSSIEGWGGPETESITSAWTQWNNFYKALTNP
jgi:RNA polymerase subunit RPABC4/transcription elongation factor Spt4